MSIPWSKIDQNDEAAWMTLAQQLVQRAIDALREPKDEIVEAVLDDLREYSERPSAIRPATAMAMVGKARGQLRDARIDQALGDLEKNTDKLNAIVTSMKLNAAELAVEAGRIRLKPIQNALSLASQVVTQVKMLEAEIAKLNNGSMTASLVAIAAAGDQLLDTLHEALGQ